MASAIINRIKHGRKKGHPPYPVPTPTEQARGATGDNATASGGKK